jgi:hypothetical protein
MAKTYEPIATNTLSSAAASYTFSSIPATYTDLVLIASPITIAADNLMMQFNGDTAANYSTTILFGTGSTAGSARQSNTAVPYLGYYAGSGTTANKNITIINIMNYSNSTTYKTSVTRANNASDGVDAIVQLWRNTAAITSILLKQTGANNLQAGTVFTLYGIKSA